MAASHQDYDVFLCHAGETKAFVRQLVDRLEKDGLKKEQIFYDEISLQPGDELDSIIKVIESPSLKLFVFVVSKYCFKSNKTWIRAEWEAALENNKQIFPIWLDDNDDGFKAFGNLVKEFSYKLRKIIAQRVNLQVVSTSLGGLSKKICSLVFGGELVNMFFRFSQKVKHTFEVEALATLAGLDANEINGSEGKHKTNQSYQANNVLLKWMEKDREASMDKLQQRLSENGLDQLAHEAGRIKAERLKWSAEAGGPLARRPAAGGSSDEGHQEIRQAEQKLVQMQHHSETQEAMVHSLRAEVTRLRDKEEQAQKVLLDHKLEIQRLQEANVAMATRVNDLLQDNEKLRSQVVLPGDGGAAAGPSGTENVQRYFFSIKEKVSVHWRDLAHFLGFTRSDIDNILYKQANRDAKDCCMDMLEQWQTRRGDAATLQVLLQALTKAGLQDTVDELNTM